MKVLIIDGDVRYSRLFKQLGFTETQSISEANLVCFTGGEDVTPSLYGAKAHQTTYNSVYRDAKEKLVFDEAITLSIPMVGICRGGQFLNVMCGGDMYQNVTDHTHSHEVVDSQSGEVVYVSSTHHQMMKPSPNAEVVAFSTNSSTREWYEGEVFKKDTSNVGIEVVYYSQQNCLCFQPHPEFESVEYIGLKKYFKSLIEHYTQVLA